MQPNSTTAAARGAIALGALFACGTAMVLFSDVRQFSDLSTDHLMAGLVLVGTIASGHFFWAHLRALKVLSSIGLGGLFLAGTFYCVVQSGARNVESSVPKQLETANSNGLRAKAEADVVEAKADLRRAVDAAAKECATGAKLRCAGAQKTQEMADSHYWLMVGRLANMKPQQVENPGMKHAAKVFAALPMVSTPAETIERTLLLFVPFAKALFLEAATVVFLGIGLGTQKPLPATIRKPLALPAPRKPSDAEAVLAALRSAGRPLTNDELAQALSISKGESSKRVSHCAGSGIITVERNGRYVAIRPAT